MDAAALAKAARSDWPKPIGLALGWMVALTCASLAASLVPKVAAICSFFGIGLFLSGLWLRSRRLERCPKGKFGFVLAISVDDAETWRIFERDFIQNLRRFLLGGSLAESVWVYCVPQFQLPQALSENDVVELRRKTRAGFVLYGQVRTRKEQVRRHYVDLSGLVGHAETSTENKQRLMQEFSELLPRRSIASEGAELPAFELTSSLSSAVAKYIAGIAAFVSGGLDYAEAMYCDAQSLARPLASQHEVARKILERMPSRITEIVIARASEHYQAWKESRRDDVLLLLGEILDKAPDFAHDVPRWKVLKAISLIAGSQDDFATIEDLVRKTPPEDPVTHMNIAFFELLRGDLRAASRRYRKANELNVSMDSIEEVMSFLEWFKDYRPKFTCEVYFALGFISYHLLRDQGLADAYFKFFRAERRDRYVGESELIEKWLGALKRATA